MIQVLGYDFAIVAVLYYQSYNYGNVLANPQSESTQMSFKACSVTH